MTDLSNLPPEVREAIEFGDQYEFDVDCDEESVLKWSVIRDYLIRITAERDAKEDELRVWQMAVKRSEKFDLRFVSIPVERTQGTANEWHLLRVSLAKAQAERDALAKRIADAPVAQVQSGNWNPLINYNIHELAPLNGKRVALVKVDE